MAAFLDTNIVIYATIDDRRTDRALAILVDPFHISVQTLNELTNVMRKKLKRDWIEIEDALAAIALRSVAVHPILPSTQLHAISIAKRHNFSIYDAQVIASALEAGCDTLFSEDMQDGMVIENGLTIRNPFV
ncbi:MAG: PIN domain-containing protein [Sphingomonadaceae bacterium]